MTAKETTLTMDRKPASRGKILAAARRLFVERGYHDTRPQDIAKEAGVGHGTFYLHFADKRACFLSFIEEAVSEIQNTVRPVLDSADSLEVVLDCLLVEVEAYEEKNPGVLAAAMSDTGVIDTDLQNHPDSLVDIWAKVWADAIRQMQAAGKIRRNADPLIAGYAIVGALNYAGLGRRKSGKDAKALRDMVVPFIVEGLAPH